jgi:hypothetical protein
VSMINEQLQSDHYRQLLWLAKLMQLGYEQWDGKISSLPPGFRSYDVASMRFLVGEDRFRDELVICFLGLRDPLKMIWLTRDTPIRCAPSQDAYQSLWSGLRASVFTVMCAADTQAYRFVGHGMGAPMALMAQLQYSGSRMMIKPSVTYGSPLVGDQLFASRTDDHWRVVNRRDPVPRIKGRSKGMVHGGCEERIGRRKWIPGSAGFSDQSHLLPSYIEGLDAEVKNALLAETEEASRRLESVSRQRRDS